MHAVVVRSAFRSQKCDKLTGSVHFWKLRCSKSARRCGRCRKSARAVARNAFPSTPGPFTVEVRMEKPVGLHGSRLRPIPGEKVKLGYRASMGQQMQKN